MRFVKNVNDSSFFLIQGLDVYVPIISEAAAQKVRISLLSHF